MAVVNEIVTKFSFLGSPNILSGFNKNLGKSITLIGAFTVAAVGAAGATMSWAQGILSALDPMIQLSRETGVAISTMQELGFAASQNGSDIDAVTGTIDALTSKIGDAANKGSADFARLGISVRGTNGEIKKADTILFEVRNRFKAMGLTMSQQRTFATSLGIDKSLLQLMNKTDAQLGSLTAQAREYGVATKEQADLAAKVNDSQAKMKFVMSAVSREISLALGPSLIEMSEGFSQLLADNKDWIVEGAKATVEVVKMIMASFNRLKPVLIFVAGAFVVAKIAALGFSGVMGVLLSPVVLITAAILAAVFIIDDLIVAFNGGNSVIQDFFIAFTGVDIVPIMHGIVEAVRFIMPEIKEVGAVVMDVFKLMGLYIATTVKLIVKLLTGDFSGAFDVIKDAANAMFEGIKSIFSRLFSSFGKIFDKLKTIGKFIPGLSFGTDDTIVASPGATLSAAAGAGNTNSSQTNSINQDVNIHITATNADEAKVGVQEGLQVQLREADDLLTRGSR